MTINDVSLKNLTFQTGQKKWDGGAFCLSSALLKESVYKNL